jgi:hypothetical protein
VEDATLNTPSHIHNPSSRHPFSVISRSDRVALQTEGLSLADSAHLSSNRTHPGERLWRPFRSAASGQSIACLFWPEAVVGGRSSC